MEIQSETNQQNEFQKIDKYLLEFTQPPITVACKERKQILDSVFVYMENDWIGLNSILVFHCYLLCDETSATINNKQFCMYTTEHIEKSTFN